MITTKKNNYIILEDEKSDLKGFAHFLKNHAYKSIKDQNVVVDLLKYKNISLEDLLEFLHLSNDFRGRKKSFILINDSIDIDLVPDELALVPTYQEAEDYIQMDELQRDLGF